MCTVSYFLKRLGCAEAAKWKWSFVWSERFLLKQSDALSLLAFWLYLHICYYFMIQSFCVNLSEFCSDFIHFTCLSLHALQPLSWCPLLTPGSVWFTAHLGPRQLEPHSIHTHMTSCLTVHLNSSQSSSETQTAHDYAHNKDSERKTENHTQQQQHHHHSIQKSR